MKIIEKANKQKLYTFEMWLEINGDTRSLSTIKVEAENEEKARELAYEMLTQNIELELIGEQ